jgi:hypothetical protein
VSPIDDPAWRALSGTEGANGFFWSPDSRSLGFVANGKLKTVRLSGGAPEIICDMPGGQVPSGTWSREGILLIGGSTPLWKSQSTLRIGSLKSPGMKLVLGSFESSARYAAGHLLFVRDRRLVAQPFERAR